MDRVQSRRTGRRGALRSRLGFSLLEAMFATGVLGIGLIGLIKLHSSAMRGMRESHEQAAASDIAAQIADYVGARASGAPPDCPPASARAGCKADEHNFAPPTACSAWYEGSAMPDASGNLTPVAATSAAYRVDRVVRAVDPAHHPTQNGYPPPYVLEVYACWLDDQNSVHQVETSRFVPSGN